MVQAPTPPDQQRASNAQRLTDAPDPGFSISLPESERAFDAVYDALVCGRVRLALLGPPGFGKSLLLRRLRTQPPPQSRVVFVPFAPLAAGELCSWVTSWMSDRLDVGAGQGSGEQNDLDEQDFLAWLRVEKHVRRRVVLLIDEAQSLPAESAQQLGRWTREAQGALQIVLAGIEGEAFDRVLAALDGDVQRVGLRQSLRGESLRRFANALIARWLGRPPDETSGIYELGELFAKTGGVPRMVKSEIRKRMEQRERECEKSHDAETLAAAQMVALPTAPKLPARPEALVETRVPAPPDSPWRRLRSATVWTAALACVALTLSVFGLGPLVGSSARVSIDINATPWATIAVNGRPLGVTPLAAVSLSPGDYEFVARFPDGRVVKKVVAVAGPTHLSFP